MGGVRDVKSKRVHERGNCKVLSIFPSRLSLPPPLFPPVNSPGSPFPPTHVCLPPSLPFPHAYIKTSLPAPRKNNPFKSTYPIPSPIFPPKRSDLMHKKKETTPPEKNSINNRHNKTPEKTSKGKKKKKLLQLSNRACTERKVQTLVASPASKRSISGCMFKMPTQ